MFKLLARLWTGASPTLSDPRSPSEFPATQIVDVRHSAQPAIIWATRSVELEAVLHDRAHAATLLGRVLGADGQVALNGERERRLLASYLDFVEVTAGKAVVRQDEHGDYTMILLDGRVRQDRAQPSGARARLGDARPGDIVGELSVFDPQPRLATCTTRVPCVFAVLKPQSLEWMMRAEPRLASLLLIWLTRRLSGSLRRMGARMAGLLVRE